MVWIANLLSRLINLSIKSKSDKLHTQIYYLRVVKETSHLIAQLVCVSPNCHPTTEWNVIKNIYISRDNRTRINPSTCAPQTSREPSLDDWTPTQEKESWIISTEKHLCIKILIHPACSRLCCNHIRCRRRVSNSLRCRISTSYTTKGSIGSPHWHSKLINRLPCNSSKHLTIKSIKFPREGALICWKQALNNFCQMWQNLPLTKTRIRPHSEAINHRWNSTSQLVKQFFPGGSRSPISSMAST